MKKIPLIILLSLFFCRATAQDKPLYEVHVAFISNFMKYVQWPNEADGGEFVVGVLGDDDVFNTLKSWYDGKPKGSKKLIIKKLSTPEEASGCSVIYLAKSKSKTFDAMKTAIGAKPVLTITDGLHLGSKGSCFNFREVDGKLKFEMNQSAFDAASLKVASQLANMAIKI